MPLARQPALPVLAGLQAKKGPAGRRNSYESGEEK
jgi:hypothetical protein